MFRLTTLAHDHHLHSTLEKIIFLSEYTIPYMHATTTVVSFSALLILVALRIVKNMFTKYWWIYRLPEVLIVVVVSISMFSSSDFECS